MDVKKFIRELPKNDEGLYLLNMFDNSILHDSLLESSVRCGAPGNEPKPKKVRFVKSQNPWNGITFFTDKMYILPRRFLPQLKLLGF